MKKIKIGILFLLVVLLLSGCKKEPSVAIQDELLITDSLVEKDTSWVLPVEELVPNEDGLYEILIPKTALGGTPAEETVANYHEATGSMRERYDNVYTDMIDNKDGTVTFVFTEEQLEATRINSFTWGHDGTWEGLSSSTYRTEYGRDDMSEISVFVNRELYEASPVERGIVALQVIGYAAVFQLTSGVPADQWKCTITVVDGDTNDIISVTEYPHEGMYNWS